MGTDEAGPTSPATRRTISQAGVMCVLQLGSHWRHRAQTSLWSAFRANPSSELTSGREQSRRSRQIVGMMDGPEETGAWRTAQELRFQPEVQLVWVRLHLFLKQEEGERMKPGEQLRGIGD